MKCEQEQLWDVVVIGGGPAGMIAAGRAAERGKKVLLLEKNATLGKKLLITGGGRCNVTNNKIDLRTLLPKYGASEPFLYSAFAQFAVVETLDFFRARGMEVKEENDGRLFPASERAQSVLDVLMHYIEEQGVVVRTGAVVASISRSAEVSAGAPMFHISLQDGAIIQSKSCVVAVGGTSHPETGSTGDGFAWMRALGHTIKDNTFSLVPVALQDSWVATCAGVTLLDAKLSIYLDGVKQPLQKQQQRGRILFTHVGLSGPLVLNRSKYIGELLGQGEVTLALDLFPTLDPGALKARVQELLIGESNKQIKNTLGDILPGAPLPKSLVAALLNLANINGDTPNHSVRSEQRSLLVSLLKHIPLHVSHLLGADKAIVSSGGVVPNEVDFKTMQSRVVPGLYIVGDLLDIDRPSGGYSLQLCWTTGFVVGNSC